MAPSGTEVIPCVRICMSIDCEPSSITPAEHTMERLLTFDILVPLHRFGEDIDIFSALGVMISPLI